MFSGSDLMLLAEQELGHGAHADGGHGDVAVGAPTVDHGEGTLEMARHARPAPNPPTEKPHTLNEAFVHLRLPPSLHQTFLEMLGSEDGEDDADVAAHVPPEVVTTALDEAVDRDGNLLTPLQKGHVLKFLKGLRRMFPTMCQRRLRPSPRSRVLWSLFQITRTSTT